MGVLPEGNPSVREPFKTTLQPTHEHTHLHSLLENSDPLALPRDSKCAPHDRCAVAHGRDPVGPDRPTAATAHATGTAGHPGNTTPARPRDSPAPRRGDAHATAAATRRPRIPILGWPREQSRQRHLGQRQHRLLARNQRSRLRRWRVRAGRGSTPQCPGHFERPFGPR